MGAGQLAKTEGGMSNITAFRDSALAVVHGHSQGLYTIVKYGSRIEICFSRGTRRKASMLEAPNYQEGNAWRREEAEVPHGPAGNSLTGVVDSKNVGGRGVHYER